VGKERLLVQDLPRFKARIGTFSPAVVDPVDLDRLLAGVSEDDLAWTNGFDGPHTAKFVTREIRTGILARNTKGVIADNLLRQRAGGHKEAHRTGTAL